MHGCDILAKGGRLGFSIAQEYHAGPLDFKISPPVFISSQSFSIACLQNLEKCDPIVGMLFDQALTV